jgi:hypothetical protein
MGEIQQGAFGGRLVAFRCVFLCFHTRALQRSLDEKPAWQWDKGRECGVMKTEHAPVQPGGKYNATCGR